MKILIGGAGWITDELLKRISENWQITLIEKAGEKLEPFGNRFPSVVRLMNEDASSPVVLESAKIREQDCVLALTDNDNVNLAIVRFASEADVKYILALVRNAEMVPEFHKLGIWTVSMSALVSRRIYQFLKDPRIEVFDLGEGEGELMELHVGKQDLYRFCDIVGCDYPGWRLVGVLREKKLLFPDELTTIEEGDRLLILGKAELYNEFGTRLKEARPHFPRTYGQEMLIGVPDEPALDITELLNEAFYLAQGTHVEKIKVVFEKPSDDIREILTRWSESLQIEVLESEGNLPSTLVTASRQGSPGVVIVPYTEKSFWKTLLGSDLVGMATKLPCPLLLSRNTDPYERLLVPFNGTPASERALEIAVDLSRQIDAAVSVVVVVEPSYLRGERASGGEWEKGVVQKVRELARVHEIAIDEQVRHGNPVKEIAAVSEEYQLMVIAHAEGENGLFSPSVANMIVRASRCSVLLVT